MREYSKGSVQKDHGQWKAVISWQDGTRQRKRSKTTGIRCYPDARDKSGRIKKKDNRGKAAAEEFLKKWRDELIEAESKKSEEESTPARANGTPLYDYAKAYYEMHHVKPSTKAGYHAALVRLAGTEAGATALGDLSATTFYRWEQSLYEDGLSENTVAHYHAFLAQVLKHAVGEGRHPPRLRHERGSLADERHEGEHVPHVAQTVHNRRNVTSVHLVSLPSEDRDLDDIMARGAGKPKST